MNDYPKYPPKLLPPVYFLAAIILMLILHFFLPILRWAAWPWNLPGVVLIALGFSITLSAVERFKQLGTAIKPFESSSALVTDGMFRFSRNPMYLGLIAILLGTAISLESFSPFLVPPVFGWWIRLKFVVKEELMLTDKFGDTYLDYKKKVRRWL